jgi:hypothetical protein
LAPRRRRAPQRTGCVSTSNPPLPSSGDNDAAEHRFVETLMPLVRLLARQAAAELVTGGAADTGDAA